MAKPRKPRVTLAVVRLAAACQRSRSAWVRPAGWIPTAASQSQNAWPQVNARMAYRVGAGDQGPWRGRAEPHQQGKPGIPAQHAQMRVPGQGVQPVMQPRLEGGKVRITIGQDPGAGEQVP
jgi:hypothetical protein